MVLFHAQSSDTHWSVWYQSFTDRTPTYQPECSQQMSGDAAAPVQWCFWMWLKIKPVRRFPCSPHSGTTLLFLVCFCFLCYHHRAHSGSGHSQPTCKYHLIWTVVGQSIRWKSSISTANPHTTSCNFSSAQMLSQLLVIITITLLH